MINKHKSIPSDPTVFKYLLKYQRSASVAVLSRERSKKPRPFFTNSEHSKTKQDITTIHRLILDGRTDDPARTSVLPFFPYNMNNLKMEMMQNTDYFQYIVVNEMFLFMDEYLKFHATLFKIDINNSNEEKKLETFMRCFSDLYILFKIFNAVELDKYEKNIDYKLLGIFKILRNILEIIDGFVILFDEVFESNDIPESHIENNLNNNLKNSAPFEFVSSLLNLTADKNNINSKSKKYFNATPKENEPMNFLLKHLSAINDIWDFGLHTFLLNNLRKILKLNMFTDMKRIHKDRIINSLNYSTENSDITLHGYANNELLMNFLTYKKVFKAVYSIDNTSRSIQKASEIKENVSKIKTIRKKVPFLTDTQNTRHRNPDKRIEATKVNTFNQKQINLLVNEQQFSPIYSYKSVIQVTKLKLQFIELLKMAERKGSLTYRSLVLRKLSHVCFTSLVVSGYFYNCLNSDLLSILNRNGVLEDLDLINNSDNEITRIIKNIDETLLTRILRAPDISQIDKVDEVNKIGVTEKGNKVITSCEASRILAMFIRTACTTIDKKKLSDLIVHRKNRDVLKHFLHSFTVYRNRSSEKYELDTFLNIFHTPTNTNNMKEINLKEKEIKRFVSKYSKNILHTFRRIMSTFQCPTDGNTVNFLLELIGEVFSEKYLLSFIKYEGCTACFIRNSLSKEIPNIYENKQSLFGLLKSCSYVLCYSFMTLNMDLHLALNKQKKVKKTLGMYVNSLNGVECIKDMQKAIKDVQGAGPSHLLIKVFVDQVFNEGFYKTIYESVRTVEIKYMEFIDSYDEVFELEIQLKNIGNNIEGSGGACLMCLVDASVCFFKNRESISSNKDTECSTNKGRVCERWRRSALNNLCRQFYYNSSNTKLLVENLMYISDLQSVLDFITTTHDSENQSSKSIIKNDHISKVFSLLEIERDISKIEYSNFIIVCFMNHGDTLKHEKFVRNYFLNILQILKDHILKEKDTESKIKLESTAFLLYYLTNNNIEITYEFFNRLLNEIKYNETEILRFFIESLNVEKVTESESIFEILELLSNNKDIKDMKDITNKVFRKSPKFHLYHIINNNNNTNEIYKYIDTFSTITNLPFLSELERKHLVLFLLDRVSHSITSNIMGYQVFVKNCYEYIFTNTNSEEADLLMKLSFLVCTFQGVLLIEISENKETEGVFIRLLKQLLYYTSLLTKESDVLNMFLRYLFNNNSIDNKLTVTHCVRICVRNLIKCGISITYSTITMKYQDTEKYSAINGYLSELCNKINSINNIDILHEINKLYEEIKVENVYKIDVSDFNKLFDRVLDINTNEGVVFDL